MYTGARGFKGLSYPRDSRHTLEPMEQLIRRSTVDISRYIMWAQKESKKSTFAPQIML